MGKVDIRNLDRLQEYPRKKKVKKFKKHQEDEFKPKNKKKKRS
tara:strand:- start:86 stop:214 length:129 start_codon:yes stop_codon:yes gene_type:complete